MKKIGLLSDTHAYWDDRYEKYFGVCDEIWHAGDIGSVELLDRLESIRPVRAVYGNIDGQDIRVRVPKHQRFMIEGVDVWMTHIGGYPGRYDREVTPQIYIRPPKLFISGHSHILKVLYDKTLKLLHVNPGAAGKYGFHKKRTLVRFVIDNMEIKDLEVIELGEVAD
ncbi:MAG: metallophosphoesterase family protein [Bacteroidaceae bacterium]|nr:metallophosphoesterase family protein [Bacteroidaceae bacterium]